jgi:hypothetical protein
MNFAIIAFLFIHAQRCSRPARAALLLMMWPVLLGVTPSAQSAPDAPLALSPGDQAQLRDAVRTWDERYDPQEQMIRRPFASPGYHTTLKGGFVHPTRDSLEYAVALLDTGAPELLQRTEDILRKVIGLQDQDSASKTYGIWSWFLEEPLEKMSPPDWNWADFCGVQLLQVALYHRQRLPAELAQRVDGAIRHAARSIQRRNVGPHYTNIAIMGTYVALITAELYDLEDLRAYAIQRLRRFHAYTLEQGAFTEYNSPTYTIVALQEVGRLRLQVKDPEARRLAEDIYRLAWEEIATHFHPPTCQWAGPHSRCYNTLLSDRTLALIQHATDGRVRFFTNDPPRRLEEYRLTLPCPAGLEHFFASLEQPRELVKTFIRGESPVIGTTYLAPEFTVGSVNRGDFWNQRRSLVAYWGTPGDPAYLHLRFLHDDYDFADCQFFSVQRDGTVLGGVVLATDGGDTHVSLDRIRNGTVRARDLRLRFEFGGAAGVARPPVSEKLDSATRLAFGQVHCDLQVPFAQFDEQPARLESGFDSVKRIAWIDVVFYAGKSREVRLNELEQAAAGFYLRLTAGNEPQPAVKCSVHAGHLRIETARPRLELDLPIKPAKVSELQQRFFTAPRSSPMGEQVRRPEAE